MLVLTRRVNESIIIDGNITVTLLGIEGDKVKLGITAPREISIIRQELQEVIQGQEKIQPKLIEGAEPKSFNPPHNLLPSHAGEDETPSEKEDPKPL